MCGQEYNVGMNEWMELMEHSREVNCMNEYVDNVTKKFGPKPTPKQVSEIARYRGFTYQRDGTKNQYKPKEKCLRYLPPSPKSIVPINT
jgi:hypothetical protein